MADTPSSSPLGTPFSSSSDTLSSKSTPPSSPDDSYDTPTRKPGPLFRAPCSPVPFPKILSQLESETIHDFDDLSAVHVDSTGCLTGPSTPPDGKCSERSSQKPENDDTATRHPIDAYHHAERRSASLGLFDCTVARMGTAQHGRSSSQTLGAIGSGSQELCIGSEPGHISPLLSDMPDTEPFPTGHSHHESVDRRVSTPPDLPFVQAHSIERFSFEFDISKVSFVTHPKKDGAGAGQSTTRGGDRSRRATLGANLTRRRDTLGRPLSRVRDSLAPATPDIAGVHVVEKVGSKRADPVQPGNDSTPSRSSHGSQNSIESGPEIRFLDEHEPHRETSMASRTDRPSKEYMQQFSYTKESFRFILPREMGQFLREKATKCVAFKRTQQDERCSRNHRGSHRVSGILRHFVSVGTSDAILCIDDLVSSVLCKQHRNFAFKDWECWRSIVPTPEIVSNNVEDHRLSLLIDWVQELQEAVKCLGPIVGPIIKSEDDQVDAPSKPRATLQHLIPWCPGGQKGRPINQMLREICVSSLSQKRDQKAGFIYIYWSRDGFGRMKIGYTEDINKRLRQWENQCEKELLLHFPKKAEQGDPIPHIFRVETLVHAELRDYRRKEPRCLKCNRGHREWFEGVSVDLAVDVAKKWIDWMRQKPYVQRDYGDKVEWVLSGKALDSLKTVCKPHEKLESGICPAKR